MASTIQERDSVQSLTQNIKDQDNAREKLKAQAFVNVMFLYGNHHFKISRRRGFDNIDDIIAYEVDRYFSRQRIKRTANYILPLYRAIMSRIIRMKQHIHVEPSTSSATDKDVARVSKECLEDSWQNINRNNHWLAKDFSGMSAIIGRLTTYQLVMGNGYLEPYFNPKAKTLLYDQASKNIFESDVGEVEMRIHHMLNVFPDRYNRYVILRRRISPEQVWDEFGVDVPADTSEYDNTIDVEIERALYGDVYGDRGKQEGVLVHTKYCLPSREYPKGFMYACTEKDELCAIDLPEEYKLRNPVTEFRYQDLGFAGRGQGMVEQLIDLQQDLNFTRTRISQVKKLMTGKLMVPTGAKLKQQWDSEVGQIINYQPGFKPDYMEPANIATYWEREEDRIMRYMEDIANSHDSSMGKDPSQVKSGIGIQNLSEVDNSMISPELVQMEQKLGYVGELMLDIMEWKYNERRLLTITGDDLAGEVKSFIGSDLVGQKRVRVRMGSGMPDDIQSRSAYIDALASKGYITKERAKELMELGDIDGIWRSLDETGAKCDIMNIVEGNMHVQAQPWEDATTRLKIINDYRKGPRYAALPPEKRQQIDTLADEYQKMLTAEADAASQMQAKQAAAVAQATEQAKASAQLPLVQAKAAAEKKPPFENLSFKDMPVDGKIQMAAQAGITLNPVLVAADHVAQHGPIKPPEPAQPGVKQ